MSRAVCLIFIVFSSFAMSAFTYLPHEDAAWSYIDTYKDLAVVEMHRSGIPASIILAQALLESDYGTSALATEANNHFGIKCKSYWVGKTYYHKDDDFRNGELIESCFRSYNSAVESYVDHSNFLIQTKHYKPLFTNSKEDYKAWAYGLKTCGYATDVKYSDKIIDYIERFSLTQYDQWDNPYKR
jgi:flagellum-specific peptidoglycan hydrolase FlgJ